MLGTKAQVVDQHDTYCRCRHVMLALLCATEHMNDATSWTAVESNCHVLACASC